MSQTSSISIPIGSRVGAVELTDFSQTPGGTIYGTTPGGTKKVYERNVLLTIRNSPYSKATPILPDIPGVTKGPETLTKPVNIKNNEPNGDHDDMFHME